MVKNDRKNAARAREGSIQVPARILNCEPSRDVHNDWTLEDALGVGALNAPPTPVPPAKDLREPWWQINDQRQTGSCVGWATADSVLRWHFVKAERLRPDELLSPRFTWMASKETDEFVSRPSTFLEIAGTSLKAALDISRNYGAVTDAVLPFGTGELHSGPEKTFFALAARLKIASYFNLGRDLTAWRRWIATSGPILTRLGVDATWQSASAATGGRLDRYQPDTVQGGHAVALVGYNQTEFVVRNSWGEAWGDRGFAHASEAYASAAFTEAYGVTL